MSTRQRLEDELRSLGHVVVAFSGGVDSSLLAHAALSTLGAQRVLAVTARSDSLATGELDHCRSLAESWELPWQAVRTDEMDDDRYTVNAGDRCRWCKTALMESLGPLARERGATVVLGVNRDDLGDHRPGQAAALELGARFPLLDAGLTKADVRELARLSALSVAERPAMPCLASRVPYGTAVTVELLGRVDQAERVLRELGFDDVRVRHYGDTARIEVPAERLTEVADRAPHVVAGLRSCGYRYVTLDLAGLRSGNLNDALAATPGGPGSATDGVPRTAT